MVSSLWGRALPRPRSSDDHACWQSSLTAQSKQGSRCGSLADGNYCNKSKLHLHCCTIAFGYELWNKIYCIISNRITEHHGNVYLSLHTPTIAIFEVVSLSTVYRMTPWKFPLFRDNISNGSGVIAYNTTQHRQTDRLTETDKHTNRLYWKQYHPRCTAYHPIQPA